MTAFVEVPASRMTMAADSWCAVTGTRLPERRGAAGEFATLLPRQGDAPLRVQGLREGPPGTRASGRTSSGGTSRGTRCGTPRA